MAMRPTGDAREQELARQLAALRADYARQLPERIVQLEQAWREGEPGSGEAFRPMARLAHGLAGSGGTFGFVHLSTASRELEQTLNLLADRGTAATPEEAAMVGMLVARVGEAALESPVPVAPASPKGGAPRGRAPAKPDETRRVYLIEDDVQLAQELASQLGHFGYAATVFHTVAEARSALREQLPDALIMDIGFPEGEKAGIEAMVECRRSGLTLPPLVFITSHRDFATRLDAVRAGGRAFFTKPVEVGTLADKLDELTSQAEPDPFRVLIVEDSPLLAAVYSHTLEQAGMLTRQVTDPLRVMEMLEDFSPELILMDMYMPGASGDEVARVLRQQESHVGVPIVFLSGETDKGKQLAAMGLGADEFLVKPIRPDHLVSSVAARIERYRTLRSFMIRDSLTGLLNHTKMEEQLDIEVERARRQGRPLSFAMIDLDHFKRVNDTYGHPTGDKVLKSLSRLLQQRLRKVDVIGRYGGEEFAVVLTDTGGEDAVRVLDGIRRDLAAIRQHGENSEFSVTFSCGVASFPDHGTPQDIGSAADKALYRAKQTGRNRVVLARAAAVPGGV